MGLSQVRTVHPQGCAPVQLQPSPAASLAQGWLPGGAGPEDTKPGATTKLSCSSAPQGAQGRTRRGLQLQVVGLANPGLPRCPVTGPNVAPVNRGVRKGLQVPEPGHPRGRSPGPEVGLADGLGHPVPWAAQDDLQRGLQGHAVPCGVRPGGTPSTYYPLGGTSALERGARGAVAAGALRVSRQFCNFSHTLQHTHAHTHMQCLIPWSNGRQRSSAECKWWMSRWALRQVASWWRILRKRNEPWGHRASTPSAHTSRACG